jgi:hypothetical protein
MTLPKRFSLLTLLLGMLLVSLVFGYAQWRQLRLKADLAKLNKLGDIMLTMPNRCQTRTFTTLVLEGDFWPSVYPDHVLVFGRRTDCGYVFAGKAYSTIDAREYLKGLERRLRAVGIRRIGLRILAPGIYGMDTVTFANVDSLE